jgi:hypothetical protein
MKERYLVQVFLNNQQSAIVMAERIAKEFDIVVDILHERQILTVHPPIKEFQDPPQKE